MGMSITGPAVLDINTQRDLFYLDGLDPLYQVERLADPMKKLFTWVARTRCPVVSTRIANIAVPGGRPDRRICVPNTEGYRKLPATIMRRRRDMPTDCGTSLPVEGFEATQQFIFDLPGLNPFESPRLDRLLSEAEVATWLIVGGPLEWTVRVAVLGLLQRRQKVAVVRDCIGQRDPYEGEMALRQIESKNIEWLTAEEAIARYSGNAKRPTPTQATPTPFVGQAVQADTPARTRKARQLRMNQTREQGRKSGSQRYRV